MLKNDRFTHPKCNHYTCLRPGRKHTESTPAQGCLSWSTAVLLQPIKHKDKMQNNMYWLHCSPAFVGSCHQMYLYSISIKTYLYTPNHILCKLGGRAVMSCLSEAAMKRVCPSSSKDAEVSSKNKLTEMDRSK